MRFMWAIILWNLGGCAALASPAGQTAIEIAREVIVREFAARDIEPDTAQAMCFDAVDVTGNADATGLVCYVPEAE